jgi:anthranilate phosphoribosyltransferase
MGMILDGEAAPEQIGALLMLLRIKEETPDEIEGFVRAARQRLQQPGRHIPVDLDWPSYAGKRQHHPWYLLAALLLAQNGYRVLMHGCEPHARDRLFSAQALACLGIGIATSWNEVEEGIEGCGFAYAALGFISPPLQALLNLRPLLGLRSPVNTFVRHLNPMLAPASLHSLHHPAYAALHLQAAQQLGQPRTLVFRGEGGECEIRPDADVQCILLHDSQQLEHRMPRQLLQRADKPAQASAAALLALWNGDSEQDYGGAAVIGTVAAALLALGAANDAASALLLARDYWHARSPWKMNSA